MAINNAVNAKVQGFQSLNSTTGVWNGRTLTPGTGISITNQDGTGGDPVISATGSTPPDSSFGTLVIVDDFLFHANNSTLQGETNWIGGNGAGIAGEAGHPGIYRLLVGSFLKAGGVNSDGFLKLANGEVTFETVLRVPSADTSHLWVGLMDNLSENDDAEPVNGIYFSYASGSNSGKWVANTSAASTRTTANSNNTVPINGWSRLKIVVNAAATSVSFFVDGVEITNSPITTNIPTAVLTMGFTVEDVSPPTVDVDLVTLKYVLTTPR